jgi:uncharacterized iron-regulated membrane protein
MRALIGRLHRYVGLATAVFLTVAGLTGSALAFYHELDAWLNPALFRVEPSPWTVAPLDLAERIEREHPQWQVSWLPLETEPGHALELGISPRLDPATGKAYTMDFDQLYVDPADGRELGRRQWGACCLQREQLMPFLYLLHYTLLLPGLWGVWLMGIVGLVWVFDCFFGLYLTLPLRRQDARDADDGTGEGADERAPDAAINSGNGAGNGRSYWQRWAPSWRIKRNGGASRLNFDLHRAGGLWFWGVLLIMAVSSVSFNLHEEVFEPVIDSISPLTPSPFDERTAQAPDEPFERGVSLVTIVANAEAEARRRGWTAPLGGVFYNASYGIAGVRFGAEHGTGLGSPWLYFDGGSGAPLGAHVPGEGSAGDIFHQIQYPLHSGQIAGLPGRILISLTGVTVAMLSITGVVIWLRKRRVQRLRVQRRLAA